MKIPIPIIILFIIILYIIPNAELVQYHEDVHKTICETYGGKANITINYLKMDGVTRCEGYNNQEKVIQLNLENEINGYHQSAILHTIIFLGAIIIIILGLGTHD